jgi:hypothetical protein
MQSILKSVDLVNLFWFVARVLVAMTFGVFSMLNMPVVVAY